jgi:hypothetical protein
MILYLGTRYYSIICTNAALCQLIAYWFVLGIPKYLQLCTKMYLVCPLYIQPGLLPSTYQVHTK